MSDNSEPITERSDRYFSSQADKIIRFATWLYTKQLLRSLSGMIESKMEPDSLIWFYKTDNG